MSSDQPSVAPRPLGPYTPAVRAGGFLICSGQIGAVSGTLPDGVGPQLTQAISNLSTLLTSHGAALDHVVKTTVFLVDIADYAVMNDAYTAAFGDHRPARSAVAVAGLPLGALVEIEAWAWVGEA
jgi:2-iminobutanoate/2-iminopropanoate deaminase